MKCLFIILLLQWSINSFGQHNANNNDWEDLNAQQRSGKLDDTSYFKKIEPLVERSFKDSTLKDKLAFFKKLAWSNDKYQTYRVKYYAYLTNNFTYMHKDGGAIYYSEKMEEEIKKIKPYINSLNTIRLMLSIYAENKTGDIRRIAAIENIIPFLKALPENILSGKAPAITCINAMSILANGMRLFTQNGDSNNVSLILNLAEATWNSLKNTNILTDGRLQQCHYILYMIRTNAKLFLNDRSDAKENLDAAFALVSSSSANINQPWQKAVIRFTALKLVDFFVNEKRYDSAEYYLQFCRRQQTNYDIELGDEDDYLLSYGRVKAAEGYYDSAYKSILKVYEIKDSIIGYKKADVNNNMYAALVAEQKNEDLEKAEAQKQQRNILIVVISLISITTVSLLYWRMRKKERDAKERIYKLNFSSQLQIMELEEKQQLIKEEEHKKLGMELHDNLANTIAMLKFRIETEMQSNTDTKLVERLGSLRDLSASVYENVRNKSHQLYRGVETESEMPFSKRIELVIANSLPPNQYKTTVIVDDASLKNVSLEIKISLLHIIQEIITNILKHAIANTVTVLIYEDASGVVINISDNGKGFNTKIKSRGLGLNSIKERVAAFKGNFDIKSNGKGTEIEVTIPPTEQ